MPTICLNPSSPWTSVTEASRPSVIVYSGTFDPPHMGHVYSLRETLRLFGDASAIVIPSPVPPIAGAGNKTPIASFEERLTLCEAAFKGGDFDARIIISPIEGSLPAPNFTYRTLEHLAHQFGGQRLGLLLGMDQLRVLDRWRNPDVILGLADIIVVPRPLATPATRESNESLHASVNRIASSLKSSVEWTDDGSSAAVPEQKSRIWLLGKEMSDASSTRVREYFCHKQELPQGWLQPSVLELIKNRGLYGVDR